MERVEQHLMRYLDGEPDSDIRLSIERVLPLLKRQLPEDVREYIAATIEERIRMKADTRSRRVLPSYASRLFPVFA